MSLNCSSSLVNGTQLRETIDGFVFLKYLSFRLPKFDISLMIDIILVIWSCYRCILIRSPNYSVTLTRQSAVYVITFTFLITWQPTIMRHLDVGYLPIYRCPCEVSYTAFGGWTLCLIYFNSLTRTLFGVAEAISIRYPLAPANG